MKIFKLGDFFDNFGDGIHGTPEYDNNGAFYFINGNNLQDGEVIILNDTPKISLNEYKKIYRPLTTKTILLSINGTLGNIAIYNGEKIALGKSACFLNVKSDRNLYFVKYILSSREFKKYMFLVAHGSTIKNLAPSQVAEYEFEAPSLETQSQIGNFLYFIDRKILLNKKINATLEAMAKTLYDYWFVQFDFPDENGKPYKTSGGKMIYNAELGREIPAGWEVKRLSDFAIYATEKISSENISINQYIATDNMLSNMQGIIISQYEPLELKIQEFKCGDILLANIRPYFKKIWLSYFDGGCNSDVLVIRSKNIKNAEYVYSTLARDDFFSYNVAGAKGTKMPRGDKTHIMQYPILSNEILTKSFVDKVRPIYRKIYESTVENNCLAALRDWLLPMLMNEQIKFKEF